MFSFFRKKEEDITLKERVSLMEKRLSRFEAELLELNVAQDVLRNKVLRKIQYKRKAEDETEEEESNYKGVPLGYAERIGPNL